MARRGSAGVSPALQRQNRFQDARGKHRRLSHTLAIRLLAVLLSFWFVAVTPAVRADVTGDDVKRALRRGTEALLDLQANDGTWDDADAYFAGGATCLITFALLQAGVPADSPEMLKALGAVEKVGLEHTYVVSLKLMALAAANPQTYARNLNDATQWLVRAQNGTGLWGYVISGNRFDHSNAQFALLALHTAAQAGVRVPREAWQKAQIALLRNQNADGGWAYQNTGESYGSMTAAGVAGLMILLGHYNPGHEDAFHNGVAPNCGVYRAAGPLTRGLTWLATNFRPGTNPRHHEWPYYWLYAAERAGILSGRRYFGPHDWYRASAEILVKAQQRDGLWNDSIVDTSFALLFLAKGHKSLAVQKLQWSADDAWNPDRFDMANLIDALGNQLGTPVAWQIVPFDAPLEDWLAAPLLYVQGHAFPQWDEGQRAKVRAFIERGGTLLAEACCGREEFQRGFEDFAAAAFPEAPLRPLGAQHAVYRLLHEVEPYELKGIDFGCRTSVIYSPQDLSCLWEQGDVPKLSDMAFKLGANIVAYAVGRRPLLDRLDVVVLPPAAAQDAEAPAGIPPAGAVRLAQVVFEGDWRPFPLALPNLAQFMRSKLGFDIIAQPRNVRLTDPDLYASPILVLSGHFEVRLAPAERTALAAHLRRGGFLLAEACCGTEPFGGSVQKLLQELVPEAKFAQLPADHPIFAGQPGFAVDDVSYTPDVLRARPGLRKPELWGLWIDGRLAAVYSPYSLSCGMSGTAFDGCWGYASEDALRLTANIVLQALTR